MTAAHAVTAVHPTELQYHAAICYILNAMQTRRDFVKSAGLIVVAVGTSAFSIDVPIRSQLNTVHVHGRYGNDRADGATWQSAKASLKAALDVVAPDGTVFVHEKIFTSAEPFIVGIPVNVVVTNCTIYCR